MQAIDIALAKMEHLHSQAQAMMSAQNRASPTLSHSSPEPPTPPTMVSRGHSLASMHSAMFSHGSDILSKLHKVSYSSPPPIACSPENNVCKLINYRGAKIAAFHVDGRELICLPQAFELFLKHLVGGLHTVYTKLKRLDVTPVVCNVEQVRVLRGLGAIQPGVNRCKLISCKEFDILYEDCTNSRYVHTQLNTSIQHQPISVFVLTLFYCLLYYNIYDTLPFEQNNNRKLSSENM